MLQLRSTDGYRLLNPSQERTPLLQEPYRVHPCEGYISSGHDLVVL